MTTLQVAIFELQVAVQARLTGDATLMGMITGVFDEVPANQDFPYISYGQHVIGPWPTFGKRNSEDYFLMDIWSSASGDEECFRILAEVRRLLDTRPGNAPLTLESYGQAEMTMEWATVMRDPDYNLRHGSVRYLSHVVEA